MKTYLFVLRKAAHSGAWLQEMLDMLLTTAAFDQKVSVLLLDDAVFHLKQNQQAQLQQLKDTAALLSVLPLYEITDIYSETESLQDRGLKTEDLFLPVQLLNREQIGAFMQGFDILIAA
ncbi:MAG: sulfurtransferase complex subunit TusC [Methylococcaceae bacterium]